MKLNIASQSDTDSNDSRLASYGIVVVFVLILFGSLRDMEREIVFPFVPVSLLIVLTSLTIISVAIKKLKVCIFHKYLFVVLNLFGILILFSALYSKYPALTLSRSLQFVIVTNCLYIILSQVKRMDDLFDTIGRLTIAFVFCASLYAILIYHLGDHIRINNISVGVFDLYGLDLSQRIEGGRVSSVFGNANLFGVRLMIGILLCMHFIKKEQNKLIYIVVAVVLAYALLLSGSRASVVGLIGGATFFVSYAYVKDGRLGTFLRIGCFGTLLLTIGFLLLNPSFMDMLFDLMGGRGRLLSGREEAWVALIEQIKSTPFFGVGYRISTEAVLQDNMIRIFNSHNLYLSILSEVGLVGLLFFLLIYLSPFVFYYMNKTTRVRNNVCQLSALAVLLAILINQIFEDFYSPLSYVFILMFFVLYISMQDQRLKLND